MHRSVVWQLVQGQSGAMPMRSMLTGWHLKNLDCHPIKIGGSRDFVKFSNATGSPSTNAMFGIETPNGRTPLQGASLDVTSPRARSTWAIL